MPEAGSSSVANSASLHFAGRAESAALLAAAIGCLQPAIDPMFLTLLSEASSLPLGDHGLIVGATQAGAALGGLAVWRFAGRLPAPAFVGAAAFACVCSLLTALTTAFPALLLLRGLYGAAMGMVFAHAMARCAARRPNTAYGGMLLLQLLLATLVSLALPALAQSRGPSAALALLALAPALACAALVMAGASPAGQASINTAACNAAVPRAGWALAIATFCTICATMLVWSFAGALASQARIAAYVIGSAVALGSLVGAATALAVMRERVVVPLSATALFGGLMIASPLLLTAPGQDHAFVASIVLLNIGSTALIIRCSGLASATSPDSRFRTLVACTHSLGMIAGPLTGSVLMATLGNQGLLGGGACILAAGLAAVIYAARQGVGIGTLWLESLPAQAPADSRQSA